VTQGLTPDKHKQLYNHLVTHGWFSLAQTLLLSYNPAATGQ